MPGAGAQLRQHREGTSAEDRAGGCRHLERSCGGADYDFGLRNDVEGSSCTAKADGLSPLAGVGKCFHE